MYYTMTRLSFLDLIAFTRSANRNVLRPFHVGKMTEVGQWTSFIQPTSMARVASFHTPAAVILNAFVAREGRRVLTNKKKKCRCST